MEQSVLCKDCKHSFIPWFDKFSLTETRYTMRCRLAYKQETVDKNFVTGHKTKPAHYETCSMARLSVSKDGITCGQHGQFWQPKNKRDLFKLIKHTEEIK
jgi:hypothetical protein